MSFEKRRTATVVKVISDLVAGGQKTFRPGHVNDVLREAGMPMGSWEVRAEFSRLEREGFLQLDEPSGDWLVVEGASLENTG